MTHSNSFLEVFGANFGTFASACLLFLIGLMNLVILGGIIKVFQAMRRGENDEAELERQLGNRGFFDRFFGRCTKAIDKEWQMYPVGVVFGMGFDTATEVLLLTTTAFLASEHIPLAGHHRAADPVHRRNEPDGHQRRHVPPEPGGRLPRENSMAARRGAGQPGGRAAWPLRKRLVRVRALPYPGLAPMACPRREPGAPSRRC